MGNGSTSYSDFPALTVITAPVLTTGIINWKIGYLMPAFQTVYGIINSFEYLEFKTRHCAVCAAVDFIARSTQT
jgi:hypothetical protein